MELGKLIQSKRGALKKYLYYRSLGYTADTAEILALVTYGDEPLNKLLATLGNENTLNKLRTWLEGRQESDPMQAIRNWYEEMRRPPEYEEQEEPKVRNHGSRRAAGAGMGGLLFCKAPPSSARKAPSVMAHMTASAPSPRAMYCVDDLVDDGFDFLEDLATDTYGTIEEKDAKNVFYAPTSTFRMTTNTASMGVVMNQLRNERKVDLSQVRVEEILNYFDYRTEKPTDEKFGISTEILPKGNNKKILYINVQAQDEVQPHQNIVLLLDTSGSMSSNRETTQAAIATIISKLRKDDTFSVVTYGDKDHVVLDGFRFKGEEDLDILISTLLGIVIDGCTYGSAGIERAYKIGAKNYRPDASNQVILITDGDLNFGITEKGGLEKLIEEKKKSKLFLSVIGTGLWNYKDDKLETLSKHGNGTYCVVNDLFDVDESINKRYISLTNIVAKDVKAQVEFNPEYVKEYRLLGYENRELNHEDFTNDKVISEPYGSGGHGVALYELVMAEENKTSDLKYMTHVLTGIPELCTVKVRYKEPLADESREVVHTVPVKEGQTQNAQLAYFLYCLSEKLRRSDKTDDYDREFLNVMLTSNFYKNHLPENGDKLEMFVKAAI